MGVVALLVAIGRTRWYRQPPPFLPFLPGVDNFQRGDLDWTGWDWGTRGLGVGYVLYSRIRAGLDLGVGREYLHQRVRLLLLLENSGCRLIIL